MAVTTTKKSGFREITGLDDAHFSETTMANGHTVWTATDDDGEVGVGWGKDDVQTHGGTGNPPLKTGSTVEEWLDANGKRHVIVRRVTA